MKSIQLRIADGFKTIKRMVLKFEYLEIEETSLETTLLERIYCQLVKIYEMKEKEDDEGSLWWNDLNSDFIRLN